MSELNEIDLTDMLFWMRKMVTGGVYNYGPKSFNQINFFQCINTKIDDNKYNLRNLISVYFDYASLGKHSEHVSKQLVELIKDPAQTVDINFISSLTIMKSAVKKMFYQRVIDTAVIKSFLDYGLEVFQESDFI